MRRSLIALSALALMLTTMPGVALAGPVTYLESEVIIHGAWRAGTVPDGDVWQYISLYAIGDGQGFGSVAFLLYESYTCESGSKFDIFECTLIDGFYAEDINATVEVSKNARKAHVAGSVQGVTFDLRTRSTILNSRSSYEEVDEDATRYKVTLTDTSGSRPPVGTFQSHVFSRDDVGSSGTETIVYRQLGN